MRVRSTLFLLAIFAAATLATVVVVRNLPLEGQVSSPANPAPLPAVTARPTPPLEPAATPADGQVELRVTAGPEPLEGAEVRLYLAISPVPGTGDAGDEPSWRVAGAATTGPGGVARIPARAGRYLAAVRAAGLAPAHLELVRVAGEETCRADVVLAPPAALAGRVTLRDGTPAAARLTAIPLAGTGPRLGPPSAPAEERPSTVADAAGRFRLDGLAPGVFALSVEAPGAHPALLPLVAVPRADPLNVTLDLLGAVAGEVRGADGRPVSGAIVRAASRDHGAIGVTAADGRFTLAAPAGAYVLFATAGGRGASAEVAIAAGATRGGVVLALGPSAAIDGAIVARADGAPLPGAEVAVYAHETGEIVAHAAAGPTGRFDVAALAPGAYDVRAAARGRSTAVLTGVTLAPGARFPLRLALAGTGSVEGVARDGAGHAVGGARVRAAARGDGVAPALPLEARTDFDGRYRFAGLEVGRADVVARQDGVDLGASASVDVAEGAASRADLVLPEPGQLAGRVHASAGVSPLGAAVVAAPLRKGAAAEPARALADATGNYRLALPEGEYRVHAAPADADPADLRVTPVFARVRGGVTTRLDVPLEAPAPTGGVEIAVLEPGGVPSLGAVVTVARAGDDRVALATTAGDDGRVSIAGAMGLAGRAVTVRARNGGRSGAWSGTLPASGTVPVRLAPGGAVEGVVTATGAPPRGLTVEVASEPAPAAWRTVDVHRFAGGRFTLGDLPAGPVRLTVVADDGRRGAAELRLAEGETRRVEIALDAR